MEALDNSCIRRQMKEKRESMDTIEYQRLSAAIYDKVINSTMYKKANTIGIYISKGKEVETFSIIKKALSDYKVVCLPKVHGDTIDFYAITDLEELKEGKFKILEPPITKKMNSIDVMYIPLLAYNDKGYRLGYGKGYYDRYLSQSGCIKIGLAFSFQRTDFMLTHAFDIPLDALYHEKEIIVFADC